MGDRVFSTDWCKDFRFFQQNPKAFIDSKRLTRDDFCMDILKDLYSDNVSTDCKCHLLISIQEHPTYLIQNEDLLEQIVGSLQNLFITLSSTNDNNTLLKTYIIVTITTLLLTWKNSDNLVNRLSLSMRKLLLDIIFSEAKDPVLRSSACRCLEELEQLFPCFLKSEIDKLATAVKNPQLLPVQNYTVLLCIALKNRVDYQMKHIAVISTDEKKMMTKSPHKTEIPIHNYISCILEALPYMSESSTYLVYKNLIHIVENTPDLLPAVFKPFLPKLIMSSSVLYFCLAFHLLKIFGSDLFSSQEEKRLLHQLMMSIKQPLLNSSQRLLYLDWFRSFVIEKNIFSISIPKTYLNILLPNPFDGPYTQEKKITLLSLYFSKTHPNVDCSDILINSIIGLKKQVLSNPPISTVSSFFRTLYAIFVNHDNTTIHSNIQKMILEIISSSPQLSYFVLDFLKCVKKNGSENVFSDTLLSMLVERVVNLTSKQCAQDFSNFSPILECAVMEPPNVCKPQAVLRQLKKVMLEQNDVLNNKWIIGHSILSICCSILKFHDVDILYHDLGELLNLVMKHIKNCDCEDRAKQYYAALTALPQARIKGLLRSHSSEEKRNISLNTIMTGNETFLYSKSVKLSKPVFELVQLERTDLSFSEELDIGTEYTEGLAESYIRFVTSEKFRHVIQIPLSIQHLENAPEEFSTIYCVVISVHPFPQTSNIPDIEVPVFKKNCVESDKGLLVTIEMVPNIPSPVILHFSVQFTCSKGFSYRYQLPKMKLELPFFFSKMPFKTEGELVRKELFYELWTILAKDKKERCLSVFCLKVPEENIHLLVESNWKNFAMQIGTENTDYNVGIFLPPTAHFLLRITAQNGHGFATVLTDCKILPFISAYMDNICI